MINIFKRKQMLVQACRLSIDRTVCPVGEWWKNGWLDLDAVWGGEWGWSRDGCIRWRLPSSKGQFWGVLWGIPL